MKRNLCYALLGLALVVVVARCSQYSQPTTWIQYESVGEYVWNAAGKARVPFNGDQNTVATEIIEHNNLVDNYLPKGTVIEIPVWRDDDGAQ